jgi:hypothetical protein
MEFCQRTATRCISSSSHDLSTPPVWRWNCNRPNTSRQIKWLEKCPEVGGMCIFCAELVSYALHFFKVLAL